VSEYGYHGDGFSKQPNSSPWQGHQHIQPLENKTDKLSVWRTHKQRIKLKT